MPTSPQSWGLKPRNKNRNERESVRFDPKRLGSAVKLVLRWRSQIRTTDRFETSIFVYVVSVDINRVKGSLPPADSLLW